MITVRTITYETDSKPTEVISKINWAVEKVDSLLKVHLNGKTVSTNKSWAGIVDEQKKYFYIIEPGKFFGLKMFQIFLKGQIIESTNGASIKLKFIPGWYLLIWLILPYISFALTLSVVLLSEPFESMWTILIWTLLFPIVITYLLLKKLNKLEKRIEQVMDLE